MTSPRILLTNDDGIHAPGLTLLESIAASISDDVWVVAPEQEQSGAAHSLSLHMPVRVNQYGEKRFSITGTPTDCVLFAKREIIPTDQPPTLALSGVNRGSNVGDDITYSGTVAGAMEATLLGIPSIAISQSFLDDVSVEPWKTVEHFAPGIISKLLHMTWPEEAFINLNFPACSVAEVKGVAVAPQGKRFMSVNLHKRIDPKNRPYYWIGGERDNAAAPDSDIELLGRNYITITPLHLDLTHYKLLEEMKPLFAR